MLTQPAFGDELGRYRLIAEIGRGGMGVIYVAAAAGPHGFNKLVAIKELAPSCAADPDYLRMFLDEARLAARLSHPNIVQTYEVAQLAERTYMVMEYLDGKSLARIASAFGGRFPLGMSLRVLCSLLDGLQYAHDLNDYSGKPLGVVHRDVSPHNVFVTYDGQVKVIDFGIAKNREASQDTRAGVLKGKVTYMSPEQARGTTIDRRSDLFSLGVMMWEVLSGRRLWQGRSEVEIVAALARHEIPSPAALDAPAELRDLCARALSANPDDRFATADEMRLAIAGYLRRTGDVSEREVSAAVAGHFAEERQQFSSLLGRQLERLAANDSGAELLRIGTSQSGTPSSYSNASAAASQAGKSDDLYDIVVELPQSRRGPMLMAALGGAVAVALIALVTLMVLRHRPSRADAASNHAAPTATATPAAPPAPVARSADAEPPGGATVLVKVRALPADARVSIDGVHQGVGAVEARFAKGAAEHHIRVSADGFMSKERVATFAENIVLDFSLERRAPARHAGGSARSAVGPAAAPPQPAQPMMLRNPKDGAPQRRIELSNPYGAE